MSNELAIKENTNLEDLNPRIPEMREPRAMHNRNLAAPYGVETRIGPKQGTDDNDK